MTLFAAIALALSMQAHQGLQPPKASLEGFVVRIATNGPLARARITLVRSNGVGTEAFHPNEIASPANPAVTTDGQGRFRINDLEPGTYRLTAQRNGFARQEYGQRAPGRPGTTLKVAAGETIRDLVFRLVPGGAVGGRISDQTGAPLPAMTVQLLRSSYDE